MSVRECTRCHATAQSTGNRCKLRTCVSARLCWRHLMTLEGLRIKESTIPNAGLGLYTTKARANNEKLDNYKIGTVRETKQDIDRRYGDGLGQYVWCQNAKNCFDAKSSQSSWSRYSNSCDAPNNRKECTGIIRNNGNLRTLRPLRAGEEIFVAYGDDYYYG